METYLKENMNEEVMGKNVLIATLYKAEPVMAAVTKMSPDRLILIIDTEPNSKQEESYDLIKKSLGKVIEVKAVKTDIYDIVAVARKCVETIDLQPNEDDIYVNITSGRKTKAIGLLFGAYARHDRVKKIAYYPEENNKDVVYLPRLSFKLSNSQKRVLEYLDSGKYKSISELVKALGGDFSTAMVYRAIDELKDMDLVSTEEDIKLTDAGKIARL